VSLSPELPISHPSHDATRAHRRNRLVVFDLDGTLIDSSRDLADATNAVIQEYGGTPLGIDEITSYVGEGAAVLVRRALRAAGLAHLPADALDRFLAQYEERLTVHTRPYPGIPEALDALAGRGCTLAVLTNKPERPTRRILEELALDAKFTDVVGGDTSAGRKPDPTGLLRIIERAGTTPAASVLVGDSPIDYRTARNAGTRICLARYGYGYRFDGVTFDGDELFADAPAAIVGIVEC